MGAVLQFDFKDALTVINKVAAATGDTTPLLRDMGEYLIIAHLLRFDAQTSPDGTKWKALSPAYLKQKKKNKDKILTLDGYLKNTLRYQVADGELLFGSNRAQAAILHFGGEIKKKERAAEVYFKQNKNGSVGRQFVKRKNSNFAQSVKIGAHVIKMPARPWLGTSPANNTELMNIAVRHMERIINS